MNLHPDDLLFFHEVSAAMRLVAKRYDLPLTRIIAYPMPDKGMADRLGDCGHDGTIRLVMRAMVDGQWVEEPRTPKDVWRTAAHELAHLRHMNHGTSFQVFELEMQQAIANTKVDHKQNLINKLVKMQASRDGEAKLGNSEAAEAFASMINKMLIENELSPSDLDYARATDNDPVIEVAVNLGSYKIPVKQQRIAWQESLARIVANAHLCRHLIQPGTNNIYFVGTKSHATVAEYVYGTLVPLADRMALVEKRRYGAECFKRDGNWKGVNGFREAWLDGFLTRIRERFEEARKAAVAVAPEGTSVALMRLEGALVKTRKYIDDRFKGSRGAACLDASRSNHADGKARGRAAADAMTLGRRGVNGGSGSRGLLKA